jgi:flagellar biosynthesis protein FliR
MMIGAIIGLAMSILLTGAEVAGLMIGRQAGIALADVYDPIFGEQESVIGQIYAICFTLLFLLIGAGVWYATLKKRRALKETPLDAKQLAAAEKLLEEK